MNGSAEGNGELWLFRVREILVKRGNMKSYWTDSRKLEEGKEKDVGFPVIDLIYGRGGQARNEMRGNIGPGEVQDQGEG